MYRRLRDAFDAYYLEHVSEWRRRAGLGLYPATSPPGKLQPVLDSQKVDAVVGLESAGSSKIPSVAMSPPSVVSATKSASWSVSAYKKEKIQSGSLLQFTPMLLEFAFH